MNIQFEHKGQKVTAKIISSFDAITDAMIVFPDSNLGELGWSIFFQRKENKWTSESFLKEKYPTTYSSLLTQVNSIQWQGFESQTNVSAPRKF
jgi:hypothetical protein